MSANNRKTKIICTLGPSTGTEDAIRELILAGMSGARFNFSHGDHKEHGERIDLVRKISEELEQPVALILDTSGPEIRTGVFKDGRALVENNQIFTLRTTECEGDFTGCFVTYKEITSVLSAGDSVLIDDGLIGMKVVSVSETEVVCEVENGGIIANRKSINLPGVHIDLPSLTNKDRNDILFGIEHDIDYVAASFTRSGEDVLILREYLDNNAGSEIRIISKIENSEGLADIDRIIEYSDAIMLARGDMGVELSAEEVPRIQKEIISKCTRAGKPVITATQMLDSMIRNPRPTRAEVADVANAVYDGTDCLMLSGETASGSYPIEAIDMMVKIAVATEKGIDYTDLSSNKTADIDFSVTNTIAKAVATATESLDASAILAPTSSGYTARMISVFRPSPQILAFSTTKKVMQRMALYWGVSPFLVSYESNLEDFYTNIVEEAKKQGRISDGDSVILIAGLPIGVSGNTNTMRIHKVGDSF